MKLFIAGVLVLLGLGGAVEAFQYAVYLVPWDYSGPQSKYYKEWGGTKPHDTLAGFAFQPYTLADSVEDIAADSRAQGRWTFDCTVNQCHTKRTSRHILMTFYARTITNILSKMHEHDIASVDTAQPYHITLCKRSEKSFSTSAAITALNRARDWRLVLVRTLSSNKKLWVKNYKV